MSERARIVFLSLPDLMACFVPLSLPSEFRVPLSAARDSLLIGGTRPLTRTDNNNNGEGRGGSSMTSALEGERGALRADTKLVGEVQL